MIEFFFLSSAMLGYSAVIWLDVYSLRSVRAGTAALSATD
jgi:hypothetical protein